LQIASHRARLIAVDESDELKKGEPRSSLRTHRQRLKERAQDAAADDGWQAVDLPIAIR
jgi:hypothetical protein